MMNTDLGKIHLKIESDMAKSNQDQRPKTADKGH